MASVKSNNNNNMNEHVCVCKTHALICIKYLRFNPTFRVVFSNYSDLNPIFSVMFQFQNTHAPILVTIHFFFFPFQYFNEFSENSIDYFSPFAFVFAECRPIDSEKKNIIFPLLLIIPCCWSYTLRSNSTIQDGVDFATAVE